MKIEFFEPNLKIEIIAKTGIQFVNDWSDRWLTVRFIVNLNGFTANVILQQSFNDFLTFRKSIDDFRMNISDLIEFNSMENSFCLKAIRDENEIENLIWQGYLMYPVGDGNMLKFKINSNVNNLEKLQNEVVDICCLY